MVTELPLCGCIVKGHTKNVELALLQYMECKSLSDAVDEHWVVYVSGERQRTVEKMRVSWVSL